MEYLKIHALVILYTVSVIMVQSCPWNCICDEYKTVCQVKTCEDELPIEYTDYLVIDGPLCVKPTDVLECSLTQHDNSHEDTLM